VNVDEVALTFNALGSNGLPISDLKADEIQIRDNGVAPRRIVAFDELMNRPIRVGILLDTSESMRDVLPASKAIANEYAKRLFRQRTDAGFVSSFGYGSEVLRSWIDDPAQVIEGIQMAGGRQNLQAGTALFGALFRACSYSSDKVDPTATGNLILLFSDGDDNAGLTSMEEAARACQSRNTKVFAFLPRLSPDRVSTGPRALRELVAKTGGRVFRAEEAPEIIWAELQEIDSEMRSQYRLVYSPPDFKHDGTFHEIELQPPDRVSRIVVRSGYFAPRQ